MTAHSDASSSGRGGRHLLVRPGRLDPPFRRGPLWWAVRQPGSLIAVVTVAMLLLTACQPRPFQPAQPGYRQIAFYGDSLLNSSAPRWRWLTVAGLQRWSTVERVDWGLAPCDHRDQMIADANPRLNIRVVVLGYYGNQNTPCSLGRDVETLYRSDLEWAVRFWRERDVRVVLVATPGRVGDAAYSPAARATRSVAEGLGVTLVDLTGAFTDPETGRYVARVGDEIVRSPDGIHMCDHDAVRSLICPSDAPGVVRLADPVATAAVAEAKLVK